MTWPLAAILGPIPYVPAKDSGPESEPSECEPRFAFARRLVSPPVRIAVAVQRTVPRPALDGEGVLGCGRVISHAASRLVAPPLVITEQLELAMEQAARPEPVVKYPRPVQVPVQPAAGADDGDACFLVPRHPFAEQPESGADQQHDARHD